MGFTWDLKNRTVALSSGKISKYTAAIDDWFARNSHTLIEVQALYGKLLHASSALPMGRAFLTGLERMLKTCSDKHSSHTDQKKL